MKSSFLLILATFFFLLLGLYLILPRRDQADSPLVQEIKVTEETTNVAGDTTAVDVEASAVPSPSPVSEKMELTLRQFLDVVVKLEAGTSASTLEQAYRYLGPTFQETVATNKLTRDDFVTLFDQETRAFPPTRYEIIDTKVINENLEEANVAFYFDDETTARYNIELERLNNSWKVTAINVIK